MSHILYIMSMQPILESDSLPPHKKIGITNNTVVRATQLQTKMPFTMYVEAAWEIPNGRAQELESALHTLLDALNIDGEWFQDPDDTRVRRNTDDCQPGFRSHRVVFLSHGGGAGQRLFFMHDGRATDLLQAISDHCPAASATADPANAFPASEACGVVANFNALTVTQKQQLLKFLRSL